VNSFAAIAAGLLRVGHDAKNSRFPYQSERADSALGGGRRGVVPPQRTRSLYQVERADSALGGGRRGVVPPQRKQP
jgi:hypothetical protein